MRSCGYGSSSTDELLVRAGPLRPHRLLPVVRRMDGWRASLGRCGPLRRRGRRRLRHALAKRGRRFTERGRWLRRFCFFLRGGDAGDDSAGAVPVVGTGETPAVVPHPTELRVLLRRTVCQSKAGTIRGASRSSPGLKSRAKRRGAWRVDSLRAGSARWETTVHEEPGKTRF